jgi:membrane protein DedA with SNARE-associated domain
MTAPALPGLFGALEPVLNHYGYLAVAALVLLEDFGIPAPGETILIAAALYAGAGRLNVVLVGVIATLAAITGDNIGFMIGHFGGRALALRYGKYVFLTAERLDKAEYFFDRHGGKIIVAARFIEGLRQANGIVAGISGMHWKRFVVFNTLGAALWVGVWVTLGYLAGSHIVTIYEQINRYSLYLLIALVVVVAAVIARWLLRRRARGRARAESAAQASPEPSAPTGTAGSNEVLGSRETEGSAEVSASSGAGETGEVRETGNAAEGGNAAAPARSEDGLAQDRPAQDRPAQDRGIGHGERADRTAPPAAGDGGTPGQSRRGSS